MQQTPLTEIHRKLGAKLIDFFGFEMPVQYTGVIEEHKTVRNAVGIFDLCHMGEFELKGPGATKTLAHIGSNDPANLGEGDIQYTILTNETGGIIDDILAYRTADGYFLVVNASNASKDYAWIKEQLLPDTELVDLSEKISLIAVQGPDSAAVVERLIGKSLTNVRSYTFFDTTYEGQWMRISRTGYTGEDGFELYFANDLAVTVWEQLMELGKEYGIAPIGLGARDTLRLEARMPLYGNEIDSTTTPLEAGLSRFVKLDKDFIGKEALLKQKKDGLTRRLIGFMMTGKGIPRQGYDVIDESENVVGQVTSGTLSPSLGKAIGTAYVPTEMAKPGNEIEILIRKRPVKAQIIKGRFLK